MKYRLSVILLFIIFAFLSFVGYSYYKLRITVNEGFYLNGEENITLEYGEKYEEAGFIANIYNKSHINDVTVNSNININKIGDYEISYNLRYMNYSKTLKRTVHIQDTTKPVLEVKCDEKIYVPVKGNVEKCEVIATDNYDKDLSDKVVVDSNVDVSKVGNYKITYTVSDSSNNTASKEIEVFVRNKFDMTYVIVYISKQRLYYYENNKLVLSTPITSGRNNSTRTGNFKIRSKVRNTNLYGDDYVSFVQYWMGYGGSFGLHDASWRSRFGTMDYKTNGSHGCINMPTAQAKKLYNMIEIGTPVYIKN